MKRNGFLLSLSANILAIFSDPEECVQFPASGKWNCIILSISHTLPLSLWACHFPSTDLSSEQILILFPNKYVMSCLANWIESRRLFRTAPRYLFRKLNNLITYPSIDFSWGSIGGKCFYGNLQWNGASRLIELNFLIARTILFADNETFIDKLMRNFQFYLLSILDITLNCKN